MPFTGFTIISFTFCAIRVKCKFIRNKISTTFVSWQSIHQLLPPPYRDVWLEWMNADKKAKDDQKSEQNKVSQMRTNFKKLGLNCEENKKSEQTDVIHHDQQIVNVAYDSMSKG